MTDTWGEAIPILDGRRPEFVKDTDGVLPSWKGEGWYHQDGTTGKTAIDWNCMDFVKLRPSHPHYQTKEPNMTKIDDALVERMVTLIKGMAKADTDEIRCMGDGQREAYEIAKGIASWLPKPVDPEKEAVRKAMGWGKSFEDCNECWDCDASSASWALAAFRAGREYQKEQG